MKPAMRQLVLPFLLLLLDKTRAQDNGVLESFTSYPNRQQLSLEQGCVLGWHDYDSDGCSNDDNTLITKLEPVASADNCRDACYEYYKDDTLDNNGGPCHAAYFYNNGNNICELHRYCKFKSFSGRSAEVVRVRRCISSGQRFAEQTPGGEIKRVSCRAGSNNGDAQVLQDAWSFVQACDALYCKDADTIGTNTDRYKYPTTASYERCRACWDDFCTRDSTDLPSDMVGSSSDYCHPGKATCKPHRGVMMGDSRIVRWSRDQGSQQALDACADNAGALCSTLDFDPVCDEATDTSYTSSCYADCANVNGHVAGACGHGGYASGIAVPQEIQFDGINSRVVTNKDKIAGLETLSGTLTDEVNTLKGAGGGGGSIGGSGMQVKDNSGDWIPLAESSRRRMAQLTDTELLEVIKKLSLKVKQLEAVVRNQEF